MLQTVSVEVLFELADKVEKLTSADHNLGFECMRAMGVGPYSYHCPTSSFEGALKAVPPEMIFMLCSCSLDQEEPDVTRFTAMVDFPERRNGVEAAKATADHPARALLAAALRVRALHDAKEKRYVDILELTEEVRPLVFK